MSRSFLGTGQVNYIGRPVIVSHDFFGRGDDTGKAVKATLNWNAYNASSVNNTINVKFNWENQTQFLPLRWKCRSVYVDNTGSAVPIYVYFPDTQWTVTAEPFSSVVFPVFTNQREAWIIGQGFTTGQIPSVTVYFIEAAISPYADLEIAQNVSLGKASATIQRGIPIFNSTYAAFALGDQFTQIRQPLPGGPPSQIFSILASGFYIITSLVVAIDWSGPFQQVAQNAEQIFESTGASGQFMIQSASLGPTSDRGTTSVTNGPFFSGMIFQSGPVQWKINAAELWQIRDVSSANQATGTMIWNFTFTQNPN